MNVQWRREDPLPDAAPSTQSFIPVNCPACAQLHLIDKQTGKLAGDN
jgi:hypothetical protein